MFKLCSASVRKDIKLPQGTVSDVVRNGDQAALITILLPAYDINTLGFVGQDASAKVGL